MSSFEWLKKVPQRTKDCVHGYIHEAQHLFPIDNPYYNIPSLVVYLCLDYYCPRECFHQIGPKMTTNEDKNIVMMKKDGDYSYNTAYGQITTDPAMNCIYKWDIKVTNIGSGVLGIGLCNIEHMIDECFMTGNHCVAYWVGGIEGPDMKYTKNTPPKFDTNDTISVEINTKDKILKYYNNNQDVGDIEWENYKFDWSKCYCLAVSIMDHGSVKLLSFQQTFV